MEHESYFATAAQLIPVIALASLLELRQFVKAVQHNGDFESGSRTTRVIAHVYTRLLAVSTLAAFS